MYCICTDQLIRTLDKNSAKTCFDNNKKVISQYLILPSSVRVNKNPVDYNTIKYSDSLTKENTQHRKHYLYCHTFIWSHLNLVSLRLLLWNVENKLKMKKCNIIYIHRSSSLSSTSPLLSNQAPGHFWRCSWVSEGPKQTWQSNLSWEPFVLCFTPLFAAAIKGLQSKVWKKYLNYKSVCWLALVLHFQP